MKAKILDIKGKVIEVDDQILYATTHGNLQIGRVIEVCADGGIKVIGKGNKRELKINHTNQQVFLKSKQYYLKNQKRRA